MRRKAWLAVAVLLAIVCLPAAGAGTGWRLDYDYRNQGDDWYGAYGAPDSRRDHPPSPVDTFSDGDDWNQGYEAAMDVLGNGPPVDRTNTKQFEFLFRFDSHATTHCSTDTECEDGLFCNGVGTCRVGTCRSSEPPDCDDGEACTVDLCDEQVGACVHDSVVPGEVFELRVERSWLGPEYASLEWDAVASAEAYNVYRGRQPDLSDMGCFQSQIPRTMLDDDGRIPDPLYLHLVTAVACGQEGTPGTDSRGRERRIPEPCP